MPKKTQKAYKLFREKDGNLYPLFVDAKTPVTVGQWLDAVAGEQNDKGKVKSSLGPLAYRPGWHAGDLPIATHIGGKSDPSLKAPDVRPHNQVWAEVEFADDVDWQTRANAAAERNKAGDIIPRTAHITDQVPQGGHYRYKTNPNMTGEWMIGSPMKVNRVLSPEEVMKINAQAGVNDLPPATMFKDIPKSVAKGMGILGLLGLSKSASASELGQGILEMLMPPTADAFRAQGAGEGSDFGDMTDEQYNEMVRMLNAR